MKAGSVAKKALQLILVQASDAELEPDEIADYFVTLNNYMFMLDAGGTALGYTEITDINQDVTVPPGALFGMIANSAIAAAPEYGGVVSLELRDAANAGLKVMRKLGRTALGTAYPSTLPVGSGNNAGFGGDSLSSNFFPDLQADILAETSGSIGLESETEAS